MLWLRGEEDERRGYSRAAMKTQLYETSIDNVDIATRIKTRRWRLAPSTGSSVSRHLGLPMILFPCLGPPDNLAQGEKVIYLIAVCC